MSGARGVKKYHDTHCTDKEVLITIQKAIDASPELRSKKALIETFISGINDVDDVMVEWHDYVAAERERQLMEIVTSEKLKEAETRKFLENAFRDGESRTTGTESDKLMPPVSRFGGGGRAKKKQGVIDKLKAFFERFFGLGSASFTAEKQNPKAVVYDMTPPTLSMVAEPFAEYGKKQDEHVEE